MSIGYQASSWQNYINQYQSFSGKGWSYSQPYNHSSIKSGSYGNTSKTSYTNANSSTSSAKRSTNYSNALDQILDSKRNPKVSKDTQAANDSLTSGITVLQKSVSALQSKDLYKDSKNGTAADKVLSAMKDYVSKYNDVISNAKNSTLTNKTSHVGAIMRNTAANSDKLSEIGITVDRNGKLSLNEDKLKSADVSKIESLFSKDNAISYGSRVTSRLGFAGANSTASKPAQDTDTDSDIKDDSKDDDKESISGAAGLKNDIQRLSSDSLYEKVKGKDGSYGYDFDKLLDAAKSFAGNYNAMLDKAKPSYNSGVTSNLNRIMEKTEQNKNALKSFGINVDNKGKMSVDEDAFRNADMSKAQDFFKNYGSSIGWSASLVDFYMTTQAGTANSYMPTGAYNAQGALRFDSAV